MNDAVNTYWPIFSFLILQTGAIAWWASSINSRIKQLETDATALSLKNYSDRMIKLEATLDHISRRLDEIVAAAANRNHP